MKAEEIRPIVEYLIEVYFENNGGIGDYKEKETTFNCYNLLHSLATSDNPPMLNGHVCVEFRWISGINGVGANDTGFEDFYFKDGEKITNLEKYVWEAIDRILEVPYYDERPREDDPTLQ